MCERFPRNYFDPPKHVNLCLFKLLFTVYWKRWRNLFVEILPGCRTKRRYKRIPVKMDHCWLWPTRPTVLRRRRRLLRRTCPWCWLCWLDCGSLGGKTASPCWCAPACSTSSSSASTRKRAKKRWWVVEHSATPPHMLFITVRWSRNWSGLR